MEQKIWICGTVVVQTAMFMPYAQATQNTEQHIKNHKTQTKFSSYKVYLKQTSRDHTKPMESQHNHG